MQHQYKIFAKNSFKQQGFLILLPSSTTSVCVCVSLPLRTLVWYGVNGPKPSEIINMALHSTTKLKLDECSAKYLVCKQAQFS